MRITNRRAPADIKINGRYANVFKVGYNAFEFVFDFGQSQEDSGDSSIHTRIVTAPGYAKAFFDTLKESITQHEERFGAIWSHDGDVESEVQQSSRIDKVSAQTE
jgi:hypothetical protein